MTSEDDFEAEIRRLREAREDAEARFIAAFEASPAVLVEEGGEEELWILSPDPTPEPEALRISFLAEDGLRGHTLGDTLKAIAEEHASPGHVYDPVDERVVIAWTRTPTWSRGQRVVAFAQARNQLTWLAGKRGREAYAWAMDKLREVDDLDIETATAYLEEAARDLQAGRAPNHGSWILAGSHGVGKLKRRLLQ